MTAAIWLFCHLIFVVGIVDDLRLRRIPNRHVAALGLVAIAIFGIQLLDLKFATLVGIGLLTATVVMIPLWKFGVLGGGDAKLMMLIGCFHTPEQFMTVTVYSLFWGALIGLIKLALVTTETKILRLPKARTREREEPELEAAWRIPFTVPLYLGFATAWVVMR